ncbi:MAG: MBL fold metallo-hydrolase [Pseudomonadota bacterium]
MIPPNTLAKAGSLGLCLLVLLGAVARSHAPGAAEYVGNEGVLVTHGAHGVLFDALFDQSYGNYVVPSDEVYADINAAEPPFDGVSALFVSHVHGDHFGAERVLGYLQAQPKVRVFGPRAVKGALAQAGADEDLLSRVTVFASQPGDAPARTTVDGLSVHVVAVPHANPQRFAGLQNLVFRVTLDDALTVMHFGDADPVLDNFAPHFPLWQAAGEAAALFPPAWFLRGMQGRAILERIDARAVIGIHVPAAAQADPKAYREALGGDAFVTPGERRALSHGEAP